MAIEIERKFLVIGLTWRQTDRVLFRQGYLNRDKRRTVRVRVAGADAYLTVKGETLGASRTEFEYAIPLADANTMMALCDGPLIEKYRYRVPFEGMCWEVDEFLGDNAGLVVAEIELTHEEQSFKCPDWLGREVTGDPRYYNANLGMNPFKDW